MGIKIVWTAQGQILGDISDKHDGLHIENPVFLAPGPQGVSMMPVLMFSEEKEVILPMEEAKFGGQLFEPILELRNHYNQQFGSGIQLLTS
jgi:hypothetical protein